MTVYYLAFLVPVLLFPLRQINRTAYLLGVTAIWVAFAGIRGDIGGADYFAYRDFYATVNGFAGPTAPTRWEPLFVFVAKACSAAGMGYNGFLATVAALGIIPAAMVIDKRSERTPLALFVYGIEFMLYGSFVILRAGIAIGLGFVAVDLLLQKRRAAALAAVAVAAGFHYSALALLAFIPFGFKLRPKARTALWALVGAAGAIILATAYSGIIGSINLPLFNRLSMYLVGVGIETINPLNIVELLLIAYVFMRYSRRDEAAIENGLFFFMAATLFACIEAIFVRIGSFYRIVVPLLYAEVAQAEPEGRLEKTFGKGVIQLGIFLYYLLKITRWLFLHGGDAPGSGAFTPFRTFWGLRF